MVLLKKEVIANVTFGTVFPATFIWPTAEIFQTPLFTRTWKNGGIICFLFRIMTDLQHFQYKV
jgi:hypothetical protein